jgi:hypothetical protein
MNIVLLGAESASKTLLAQALQELLKPFDTQLHVVDNLQQWQDNIKNFEIVLLLSSSEAVPQVEEQAIRSLLQQLNISYQVIYGDAEQQLKNAVYCIARHIPNLPQHLERQEPVIRWSGVCETCGDGTCEHRLFTGLKLSH